MNNLRELIKQVLKERTKDCGCGCHGKCAKAPMLNENLSAKITMTEHMSYHINNKKPLTENTFRYGSDAFLDLWAEARYLYSRDAINLSGEDKIIVETTHLGEYGLFEDEMVPLDLPIMEEEKVEENTSGGTLDDDENTSMIHIGTDTKTDSDILFEPKTGTFYINVIDAAGNRTNKLQVNTIDDVLVKFKNRWKWTKQGKAEFADSLDEAKDGKHVLNKPKRGGSKKFYVYVRDPKTKKVKKVSFGAADGGQNLAVKIRDPKARKAFAKRQQCDKKKDRTTPGYWSCNIGRYWKSLGGNSNFSGYW